MDVKSDPEAAIGCRKAAAMTACAATVRVIVIIFVIDPLVAVIVMV